MEDPASADDTNNSIVSLVRISLPRLNDPVQQVLGSFDVLRQLRVLKLKQVGTKYKRSNRRIGTK